MLDLHSEPQSPPQSETDRASAFVEAHYRGVYRLFLWLTNDVESAADLTQESFAAFWGSLARRGGTPDPKAWLYGIARNRWRKRCRDARTDLLSGAADLTAELELPDRAPEPEAALLARTEAARIEDAVAALPEDYREALVLRAFEELSYAEIAGVLGITENLARWRTHRARRLLTAALAELEKEETSARG